MLRLNLALSHDPQLQRQLLHLRLHVLHLQTGPLQVGQEVHRLLLAQEIVDNVVTDDSRRQQIHGEDLVQPFVFPYQALIPRSPIDGKASISLLGDAGSCNCIMTGSISFQPAFVREEEQHLDVEGIEPG